MDENSIQKQLTAEYHRGMADQHAKDFAELEDEKAWEYKRGQRDTLEKLLKKGFYHNKWFKMQMIKDELAKLEPLKEEKTRGQN